MNSTFTQNEIYDIVIYEGNHTVSLLGNKLSMNALCKHRLLTELVMLSRQLCVEQFCLTKNPWDNEATLIYEDVTW